VSTVSDLRLLLDCISNNSFSTKDKFDSWQFEKVEGGANNLLYKASQNYQKFAVKFTVSDSRQRAQREYDALHVLEQSNLQLAPKAIILDLTSYKNPVVVQSWLEGKVLQRPPLEDNDWRNILLYYQKLHSIEISHSSVTLKKSYLNASSVAEGMTLIDEQIDALPPEKISKELERKISNLAKLGNHSFDCPITLCKTDSNFRNFILQNDNLLSVDWENSGWGNPHFEIAELITHAAYLSVEVSRWEWLIDEYATIVADKTVKEVLPIYVHIMLVWWLLRLTRYMNEFSQEQDKRLTEASFFNIKEMNRKYNIYMERAELSEALFI